MITPKIKDFFQFIDYLDSNKDLFLKYKPAVEELQELDTKRNKLNHRANYKQKLLYNEVQKEIEKKFDALSNVIMKPMMAEATRLDIYNRDEAITIKRSQFNKEINALKNNFTDKDVKEIFEYKSKYLNFRKDTDCNYFEDMFFTDLDETLKELFDFFKEDISVNEFADFERKTIKVNNIDELVHLIAGKPFKEQTKNKTTSTEQVNKQTNKPIISDLKDLFKNPQDYDIIIQILVDNEKIYKDSGYWIDNDKGHKSFLASLIKHLYSKKYLKRKPKHKEIEAICKSNFGVKMGIDTIKTAKVSISNYQFIPPNEA